MKKGFLAFLVLMLVGLLAGCLGCSENSTLGDSQVDEVEAAIIQVAVGAAMTARPETVAPAYAVSTALLNIIANDEAVGLDAIGEAVGVEVDKLDLTEAEKQSVKELAELIRAKVKMELNLPDADTTDKVLIVKNVLRIVNEAARERLEI